MIDRRTLLKTVAATPASNLLASQTPEDSEVENTWDSVDSRVVTPDDISIDANPAEYKIFQYDSDELSPTFQEIGADMTNCHIRYESTPRTVFKQRLFVADSRKKAGEVVKEHYHRHFDGDKYESISKSCHHGGRPGESRLEKHGKLVNYLGVMYGIDSDESPPGSVDFKRLAKEPWL
jgi:hypothetical protein